MALIKSKTTKFGIEADYWRVGMITIDTNMKEMNFSLNLYVNKNADTFIETYSVSDLMGIQNDEEKTDLYNKYFRKDFGENYKDIYTACYEYAKEHVDFFKDAQDDEEELEYQRNQDALNSHK